MYGCYVRVEFIQKLRDEKRYETIELLKQQILRDIEDAKQVFSEQRPP
ncbi:MAG: riboflavin kinase [Gammaproteobacteria bacterium]